MEPSCPLGTTRCIPQAKFHQKPYNKSFIDQVCSVKMAEYRPRSFFFWSLLISTSSRSINTQKKKELGQCPAILTSHLVNNPYNLLLTEREGRTGEYWPEVVTVRTEHREVRTKTTEGQYSPVRLEQARLVSSLLYGTRLMLCNLLSNALPVS